MAPPVRSVSRAFDDRARTVHIPVRTSPSETEDEMVTHESLLMDLDLESYLDAKSNDQIAPCLSVVMAVFNEETTVIPLLKTVLRQRPVQEIIVVDDSSNDNTWAVLQDFVAGQERIRLLRHEENLGKGAAILTGLREAKTQRPSWSPCRNEGLAAVCSRN